MDTNFIKKEFLNKKDYRQISTVSPSEVKLGAEAVLMKGKIVILPFTHFDKRDVELLFESGCVGNICEIQTDASGKIIEVCVAFYLGSGSPTTSPGVRLSVNLVPEEVGIK